MAVSSQNSVDALRASSGTRPTSLAEGSSRLRAVAEELDRGGRIKESVPAFIRCIRAVSRCISQDADGTPDQASRALLLSYVNELNGWFKTNTITTLIADSNPIQLHPDEIKLLEAAVETLSKISTAPDSQRLSPFTNAAISYLQQTSRSSRNYFLELNKMFTAANQTAYQAAYDTAHSLREKIQIDLGNGLGQMKRSIASEATQLQAPVATMRRGRHSAKFSAVFRGTRSEPTVEQDADPPLETEPTVERAINANSPTPNAPVLMEKLPPEPAAKSIPKEAIAKPRPTAPRHDAKRHEKPAVERHEPRKRAKSRNRDELGETARHVLELAKGGTISQAQIAAELGISQPSVSRHVKTLRERGLLEGIQHPRNQGGHAEQKSQPPKQSKETRKPAGKKHKKEGPAGVQLSKVTIDVLVGIMQEKTGVVISKESGLNEAIISHHVKILQKLGVIERETLMGYKERMTAEGIPATVIITRLVDVGGHAHWRVNEDRLTELGLKQKLKVEIKLGLARIAGLKLMENELENRIEELRKLEQSAKEGIDETKTQLTRLLREIKRLP